MLVDRDEHPRETTLEALAELRPIDPGGTVTAGNASGVNDGAAAVLIASDRAVQRYGLDPAGQGHLRRRGRGAAPGDGHRTGRVHPEAVAPQRVDRSTDLDVVELNEAFAAQALAVLRELGLADDADHVNPNGGAIALGHPLGASGARLALTAAWNCTTAAPGAPSPPCASASDRAFPSCSNPPDDARPLPTDTTVTRRIPMTTAVGTTRGSHRAHPDQRPGP